MLRFRPTTITITYHDMTLTVSASFRLQERTGSSRVYVNLCGDRLTLRNDDVTLEHGSLCVVFTDPEICRKFRNEM